MRQARYAHEFSPPIANMEALLASRLLFMLDALAVVGLVPDSGAHGPGVLPGASRGSCSAGGLSPMVVLGDAAAGDEGDAVTPSHHAHSSEGDDADESPASQHSSVDGSAPRGAKASPQAATLAADRVPAAWVDMGWSVETKARVGSMFIVAVVWGVGASLQQSDRNSFDAFCQVGTLRVKTLASGGGRC